MQKLVKTFIFSVLVGVIGLGCTKKLTETYVVYDNTFEKDGQSTVTVFDYTGILYTNKIFTFNNSKVLGPFNNGGVQIDVKGIPEHNVLEVAYDLYIHDNWEGNKPTTSGVPDLFVVRYDGNPKFMTTFSNNPAYKQSYPEWFPAGNNPTKANALNVNLPGRCAPVSNTSGTSYYRMVESFAHTNATFQVNLSDALQPRGSECEKSWSIDNVVVTAYKYK
jgi:hypothetical protein